MEPKLPPEDDPTSIGNILVDMGVLERETLQQLVEEFRQRKEEMLGEFIRRKTNEKVNEGMVELALMRQRRLRKVNGNSVQLALDVAKRSQMRVVNKVEQVVSITHAISNKVKI